MIFLWFVYLLIPQEVSPPSVPQDIKTNFKTNFQQKNMIPSLIIKIPLVLTKIITSEQKQQIQ